MARAALGKRTRQEIEVVLTDTPSKRPRRSRQPPAFYNDENWCPDSVNDDSDNGEEDEAPVSLPRKRSVSQSILKKNPTTPSTPRHRDVLSGQPCTPRHTVMSAGKLFKRLTPQSPLSPSTVQTVYHSARQLFARGSEPGKLIGRESERETLAKFMTRCTSDTPNGCLYVSGPPGTGKSAMITEMAGDYNGREEVQTAYINCMSVKSSKDLYNTLLGQLEGDDAVAEKDAAASLQNKFFPKSQSGKTYLVTLDEIDHILTMGLESLYRVFEWSLQKSSRLVLIGIANALDLTDRFLPRLKSKNLKPELLSFMPYTAIQIKNIITTRLKSLMPAGKEAYVPFIHPAAIELCSRKVSSQTGDLRKAFEICRRALDLIEAETRSKHEEAAREEMLQMTPSKRPLGENVNGSSSHRSVIQITASSLRKLNAETAPRASIGHLNKITAAAFSNGTAQRLRALNLQQRAALCALVAFENRTRTAMKTSTTPMTPSKSHSLAPTIKILFDTYCRLCTRDSVLHPLSSNEFREVVGSLETLGLVNAVDGKNGSFSAPQTPSPAKRGRKGPMVSGDDRHVASCAGDKDMEAVVEGVGAGILRSILSGDALD